MSQPTSIKDILASSLPNLDKSLRQKMLQQEILRHWDDIFGKFADKIMPVRFDGDVLFINSNDNSLNDMLKYSLPNLVSRINALVGSQFIAQIKFSGKIGAEIIPPKKNPAPVENTNAQKVSLTAEEISELEAKVADVENLLARQKRLDYLISFAIAQKKKIQCGWHKCALCDVLCKPEEIICNVCVVKERERMQREIRRIFCDAPETPFRAVQEKICESVPYLKSECTLEKIEAARMDLILQTAARVSYGDMSSERAKFLVSLARQLPVDKLTPAIISRTLHEFRFNLADLPKVETQGFSKLPKGLSRKK